jgi:thioredoxin domain-containing protein 5
MSLIYFHQWSSLTRSQNAAREASGPLLGSPPVYSSHSQDLFARYGVPPSVTWALLAFKDHDLAKCAGQLYGYPNTPLADMSSWLMTHRIPSFLELTADSFQSVMNAPQQPLVLIAAATAEIHGKVRTKLEQLASDWKVRTGGTGERNSRQVVFTWMDGEKWKDWLKSMYGIKYHDEDDLDDVRVVIVDHAVSALLRDFRPIVFIERLL